MVRLLSQRQRNRQDSDRRLGARLTFAVAAVVVFSVPFILLLVFVVSSFGPLNDFDRSVARQLHAQALAEPGYAHFLNVATDVLGPTTWRVLVVAVAISLWVRGSRRVAVWAVVTITVSGLLNLAIKDIVNRARPVLPDPVSWAPGASFPSGHAMGVATCTCVLALVLLPYLKGWGLRFAVWAAATAFTVFVAYSRVALGVHWFSDVVAGTTLGVAVVAGTAAGFESWRRGEGRRPAEPYKEGVQPEE
ncbi:phosphatase PAP2 family protein [Streptosporangium sp. NBC_01639]|uniref:phosphatase PAP2 family protein n=1 Tax=unclassified Streptosporangium TaxID=2632669 RepID=UPI002DDAE7D1|nr:phosphatase PAP2 family protein [Streptosporangium sp. NBC_01756]WSC89865.1 phosphatase PAP2 family protein [Streptosporangium sp. NBC_01756]WTD51505.1 phosphatase PAP2 family protein [Streptosporangium sp. NBC_01639]